MTEAVLLCKDLEGNYTKNAINLSATREEKSTLTGELIVYLGSGMYCAYTITYTPL